MVVQDKKKPRKPPTFQHLPIDRARKLKKIWVENKKVKSKWKATKRREGLADAIMPAADEQEGEEEGQDESQHFDKEVTENGTEVLATRPKISLDKRIRAEGKAAVAQLPISSYKSHTAAESEHATKQGSLRVLAREAYSPFSLHTHKSNPLHKRKQHNFKEQSKAGASGIARRGQPNMKLRMDVMLEKIKRDYTGDGRK